MIIKWLNQHPKLRTTAFWTSAIAALVMIATRVADLLGYQIEAIINQYQEVAMLLITVLASLGVLVVPPQTKPEDLEQANQNPNP